jgi:hypothetical protein
MSRLLILWLEISQLQCAFTKLSLKYRICAESLEPRAPVKRIASAWARETVHIYGNGKSEYKSVADHEYSGRTFTKATGYSCRGKYA